MSFCDPSGFNDSYHDSSWTVKLVKTDIKSIVVSYLVCSIVYTLLLGLTDVQCKGFSWEKLSKVILLIQRLSSRHNDITSTHFGSF